MPRFTVETTYLLPVCRQRTYEAATVEEACAAALSDDEWDSAKTDYDGARPVSVTGVWEGRTAYRGRDIAPKEASR